MERIERRARPGEIITYEYLKRLQQLYSTFRQEESQPPVTGADLPPAESYVLGSIGVGKTTFVEHMGSHTQVEPLEFWNLDLLAQHIHNASNNICDTSSFVCQLRMLLSHFVFRKRGCIYERHILEEKMCFLPQCKHCFTPNQYFILEKLYDLVTPLFLKGSDFYCLKTPPIEIQMQQIKRRGRKGENQYSVQYIQELNARYEKLFEWLKTNRVQCGINHMYMIEAIVDSEAVPDNEMK